MGALEGYTPDFFDFIVIDECHRGGARDESTWRGILDYFAPAVQLGMTATPKRDANVDTYAHFGEPVCTYALKDGIGDGSLTPFKLRRIAGARRTGARLHQPGQDQSGRCQQRWPFSHAAEANDSWVASAG